jgi:hypothetical protein
MRNVSLFSSKPMEVNVSFLARNPKCMKVSY